MSKFPFIQDLTSLILLPILFSCNQQKQWNIKSEQADFKIEIVADSITVPFGMAFLPDGRMLVTDRPKKRIILLDLKKNTRLNLRGLPKMVEATGDGGILDILIHPDFDKNRLIYLSYSLKNDSLSTMVVDRLTLINDSLAEGERIFTALPYYKEPNHFGSRMILKDGYLFISMGERYFLRDAAQSLGNHLGKIMRVYEDGKVPNDNPFVKVKNARPEIWSYGHRNPQGMIVHPDTKEIWEHEHGPKGGDEINIIQRGVNYGWPVICYGIDYDGKPIGKGITSKEGMEQPLYHFTPSIAPSGMEFYTGDAFPKWKGSLFIGAMALHHLNRLVIRDNKVVHEERLFEDLKWRVRCVRQGPDGFIYIGVDGGMILRLRPT